MMLVLFMFTRSFYVLLQAKYIQDSTAYLDYMTTNIFFLNPKMQFYSHIQLSPKLQFCNTMRLRHSVDSGERIKQEKRKLAAFECHSL